MIVISGVILVSAENRDEVIACLSTMRKLTLEQDPGVVCYRFATDIEDPNQIHIYEEWESTDTLKAHGLKPHMNQFRELRKRLGLETKGFSRWRAEELGEF